MASQKALNSGNQNKAWAVRQATDQVPTSVKSVPMTVMKNQTADNTTTGHPKNAQYVMADSTSETNAS